MSDVNNGNTGGQAITTVTRALEVARDSPEGASDPTVSNILETALADIWRKIQANPTTYVMTRDEFAVFNYFQARFTGQQLASDARRRQPRQPDLLDPESQPSPISVPVFPYPLTSKLPNTSPAGADGFYLPIMSNNDTQKKSEVSGQIDFDYEDAEKDNFLTKTCEGDMLKTASHKRLVSPLLAFVGVCAIFTWLLSGCFPNDHNEVQETRSNRFGLVKDAVPPPATTSAVLNVFQVYQPVLTPLGATDQTTSNDGIENTTTIGQIPSESSCQLLLMNHSFGLSYGKPFVGNYTPPNCKFNRVSMNFTVTSRGRQYDRLALMYFNDTEVWRTSTAEPTANGIVWEYIKDMTEFIYFWNSPQTLIFDLGNLIDSTYTGPFNTTLTATFFTSQETVEPAAQIIPISARRGSAGSASVFMLPSDNATNSITLPRNANRAVFAVSACGQATEEFWWSNVLQSDIDTFEAVDGTLYGYSPFREVQILIDGQLAGVHWPFPVIFTGGVVPGLWRPIVGIDAFDLREHEIDITPWLPVLSDGKSHSFEIRVAGIDDDGKSTGTLTKTVGDSWYVTGKIFLWLDKDSNAITTGTQPTTSLPDPIISLSQTLTHNATGSNETLSYTTNVQRTLSISSTVKTSSGSRAVSWKQNLKATNYGLYTGQGIVQVNQQSTTGTDESSGGVYYKSSYSYPLWANTTYIVQPSGNFTIGASINRGLTLNIEGTPVFPTGLQPFGVLPASAPLVGKLTGTELTTTQVGNASYFASPSAGISSSYGSTSQDFKFTGTSTEAGFKDLELYSRSVAAVNGTVIRDSESLVGVEVDTYTDRSLEVVKVMAGTKSPKEMLGRGPGTTKQPLIQSPGK